MLPTKEAAVRVLERLAGNGEECSAIARWAEFVCVVLGFAQPIVWVLERLAANGEECSAIAR